jgi:hypothetical protein
MVFYGPCTDCGTETQFEIGNTPGRRYIDGEGSIALVCPSCEKNEEYELDFQEEPFGV